MQLLLLKKHIKNKTCMVIHMLILPKYLNAY